MSSYARSPGGDDVDADPQHVLDVDDLTPTELTAVLDRAAALKAGEETERLDDRMLALLFEQPSTRTRASFEAGMTKLGGGSMFLGPGETQLARGEPIKDTSRALSQYVDAITARVADHDDLAELAAHATVPVINSLTDRSHPCQALADLLTIREAVGPLSETTVAWVGDGNNVAASFAIGCAMTGVELTVATPSGYGLDDDVVERADAFGGAPVQLADPTAAVANADVVYTDVWQSMSDDDHSLAAFDDYQLNEALLSNAPDDAAVMHCLPAHRGEEITDDVIESDRSLVWRQAENRMHVQTALLLSVLG